MAGPAAVPPGAAGAHVQLAQPAPPPPIGGAAGLIGQPPLGAAPALIPADILPGLAPAPTAISMTTQGGHTYQVEQANLNTHQAKLDLAFTSLKTQMKTHIPSLDKLVVDVGLGVVIYSETGPGGAVKEVPIEELLKDHPDLKEQLDALTQVIDDLYYGKEGGKGGYRGLGAAMNSSGTASIDPQSEVAEARQRKGYRRKRFGLLDNPTPKFDPDKIEKVMSSVYKTYKNRVLEDKTVSNKERALRLALQKMQAGASALYTMEKELKAKLQGLKEPEAKDPTAVDAYIKEKQALEEGLQQIYEVDWRILFSTLVIGSSIDPSGKTPAQLKAEGVKQAKAVSEFIHSMFKKEAELPQADTKREKVKRVAKRVFRWGLKKVGGESFVERSSENDPAAFPYAASGGNVAFGFIPPKLRNGALLQYSQEQHIGVRVQGSIEEAIVRMVGDSDVGSRGSPGYSPPLPVAPVPIGMSAPAMAAGTPGYVPPGGAPPAAPVASAAPVAKSSLPSSLERMLKNLGSEKRAQLGNKVRDAISAPPSTGLASADSGTALPATDYVPFKARDPSSALPTTLSPASSATSSDLNTGEIGFIKEVCSNFSD